MKQKLDNLGSAKMLYLISVISLVLAGIMAVLPVITASYGSYASESATLFESIDGPAALNFVLMLLILGAAAISAKGLYSNAPITAGSLTFGMIMRIVALFLLVVAKLINDDRAWGGIEISFAFAGWILLLCCVGGFVVDIMAKKAIKNRNNQNNNQQPPYMQ